MLLATFILFIAITCIAYLWMRFLEGFFVRRLQTGKLSRYATASKYIAPMKLLRIQLWASPLAATILLCLLLCFGVRNPWLLVLIFIAVFCTIWQVPLLFCAYKDKKRARMFEEQLLTFLMELNNGMSAGISFPQSLESVVMRSPEPLHGEFLQMLKDYRLGLELPVALERLAARMPGEDMRLFVTAVKLTIKTGGSLVEVLADMVIMIRQRREFSEKIRTMTASGRFEALMISLAPVLAFGILFLVDRDLVLPLVTTGMGWAGLGVIAFLIAVGYFFINKIVTIEP